MQIKNRESFVLTLLQGMPTSHPVFSQAVIKLAQHLAWSLQLRFHNKCVQIFVYILLKSKKHAVL